jgi:glucokinase
MKNKKKYIIGVDAGGTKVLNVLFDRDFKIVHTVKTRPVTDKTSKQFLKSITQGVEALIREAKIKPGAVGALGMGCAGMIKAPKGIVRLSPNIPCLRDYPLQDKLASHFDLPVHVDNDVNVGLYGEHQFGAARGYEHVVGIFLGTGVGGALILNNQLYYGATGAAGEIGHMFVTLDAFWKPYALRDTIENTVSRTAIATDAANLAVRQKAPQLFKTVGADIRRMKSGVLAEAISDGDRSVEELLIHKGKILGMAMASIVNLLSPEMIVLGGGVIEAMGHLIVPAARETMKQFAMPPLVEKVKVSPARLKDYAGAKGAAKLAVDRTFKS